MISQDDLSIKEGDYIAVLVGDEQSPLERLIQIQLKKFSEEKSTGGRFYVNIYCLRPNEKYFLPIPGFTVENDVCCFIFSTLDKGEVAFADVNVTYTSDAAAGNIQISNKKLNLNNHDLLMIASEYNGEIDFRQNYMNYDILGLVSLILGSRLHSIPIISQHFSIESGRFFHASLKLSGDHDSSSVMFSPVDIHGAHSLHCQSQIVSSAMWLSGRAAAGRTSLERVIFYHAALEVISNCNQKNFFSSIYRKFSKYKEVAIDTIDVLNLIRNKLLHNGERRDLERADERRVHALILDGIIYHSQGKLEGTCLSVLT